MKHIKSFLSLGRRTWLVVVLLLFLIGAIGGIFATTASGVTVKTAANDHFVFLPFVRNSQKKSEPPVTPPPTIPVTVTPPTVTPPPTPAAGGIFLDRTVKTASAAVVMDKNGGQHTAYIHYLPSAEDPPAIYGYCGANCDNEANWKKVSLLYKTREVQLALTAAGQPRLLIVTESEIYSGGKDYHYAACDVNCTEVNNWDSAIAFSSWGTDVSDILNDRMPQRSFALDPQGRPRFIYQDRNYFYREPDHYGAFYAFCDSDCTNSANWQETEVGRFINYDAEIFDFPSLTFTTDSQPRIISRVFAKNLDGSEAPTGLYYYECNGGCEETDNWQRLFLVPTGGGSYPHPGWDIELDGNNRPRVALFTGDGLQPDTFERRLLYLWCDSDCLSDTSWEFSNLGFDRGDGQSPDLELTSQGKPRIAWIDAGFALNYSWCNTACESDTSHWQYKTIETEAELRAEFPQAIPLHCDSDIWEGLAPVLSLDSQGVPHIAYDLSVEARCLYEDPVTHQPYYKFEPVWRAARVVYLHQP